MTALCQLLILLVTLVSFIPSRSGVSALKCIRCVAVDGGTDEHGIGWSTVEVESKSRWKLLLRELLPPGEEPEAAFTAGDLFHHFGRSKPSEENQKCIDGDKELEAICGLKAIACVREELTIEEKEPALTDKLQKRHNRIVRRDCSTGPVYPMCYERDVKRKHVGLQKVYPKPAPITPKSTTEALETDTKTTAETSTESTSETITESTTTTTDASAGRRRRRRASEKDWIEVIGKIQICACESENCNPAGSLRGISIDKMLLFPFIALVFRTTR